MDDAPTSPTPDPVTNPTSGGPPAPGATTPGQDAVPHEPHAVPPSGTRPPEESPPGAWAPAEPETTRPVSMPAPPGRTVARSTFLAGMALAAALGVAGAGILFTLRDQVTETASVGAPHAIHEGGPDDRFGQRGGGRDAGQDWSTRNDTGRHGPQAPGDGRTPPGGGRHGGDGFHHQDDATGTPQLDATGTPEPDASSAPEASQSPS